MSDTPHADRLAAMTDAELIEAAATVTDEMDRRRRAYEIARMKVAELYAVKNDRGYPRFSGNVGNVIEEELKIARFLLDE